MNIYIPLFGRLGNQLFIIAGGLYLKFKYKLNVFFITDDNINDNNLSYLTEFKDMLIDQYKVPYCQTICIEHPDYNIKNIIAKSFESKHNINIYITGTCFQHYKFVIYHKIKNKFQILLHKYSLINKNYDSINYENSIMISIRRGDYFPFYYVLSKEFYIDMYNKYFSGLNIYISSDDLDYCKKYLTIDKFNNCPKVTYIDNLNPISILNYSLNFKNYILSNSSYSALMSCLCKNQNPKIIGFHSHKPLYNPKFMFTPNCLSYDITNIDSKYLDIDGQQK